MNKFFKTILITLGLSVLLISCNSKNLNENSFNSNDKKISSNAIEKNTNELVNTTKSNSNENANESDTNNKNTNKKAENNIIKNNTDKNKFKDITIVIDPGHSSKSSNEKEPASPGSKEKKLKDTVGSTGVNSNIPEYEITHEVSFKLKKILEEEGYNVILTKNNINEQLSNIERADIGNKHNANLLIRIHCDSFSSKSANGASMLVPKTKGYVTTNIANQSYSYGEKIINAYTETTGIYNRGVVLRDDLTGFNWSKVPVVLLELGFISNPKEESYLSNSKNYNQIAEGIAKGINNCFK